jgi:hypothetical protein
MYLQKSIDFGFFIAPLRARHVICPPKNGRTLAINEPTHPRSAKENR